MALLGAERSPASEDLQVEKARLLYKQTSDQFNDEELATHVAAPTPSFVKLEDKVFFVLGVVNIILLTFFCFGPVKWLLVYFTTIKFLVLIPTRFWLYRKSKSQYFLLDLCYFANGLLLVQMWLLPGHEGLFAAAFSLACGPLMFAVALFRNSLVFHSLDKITSCFIHVSPFLTCYVIRYHQAEVNQGWNVFTSRHFEFELLPPQEVGLMETFVYPFCFFLCHQVMYALCVNVVCRLPEDPEYLTCYRYLISGSVGDKLKKLPGGERFLPFWYFTANATLVACLLLPGILYYRYFWLMIAYGTALVLVCIWNGANFYVEVFSKNYQKEVVERAQGTKPFLG
mmetsp:Transcript_130549/g.325715  ORF Transcript_130549/g.325715 Transcript_130549/m.325715 type:complete len:341 (+) Transcript_130549:46-1068(+)|eukprot:CAMPEP_0115659096 /NCGR_PEP_ID=MMETSP0272-20121206/45547_1 /TAXON_ID=71861 /ORGANISM="Scrippsiella trochoidea, Strain CCMP3099" /LENGTH=340 /DNA_ID=CAMNT_0003097199 /DNA_START=43 /DNA_END=1065 /DNA_ORIENTATION=+